MAQLSAFSSDGSRVKRKLQWLAPPANKNLKRNADGSLTLYAGAKSPGGDKQTNWLPAPNGHFSLYIRAYWGKAGIDESWTPPVIKKVA
ncbi:hypothetical protein AB7M17_006599 [Bradyrhizobium sp. USDA 377]